MMRFAIACMLTAIVCMVTQASDATAARGAEPPRIIVQVTDVETGRPIPLARVSLSGPRQLFAITGGDGLVVFQNVPAGKFDGQIFKAGYRPTVVHALAVTSDQDVNLSATLSRNPKIIASVQSHSTMRPRATIGDDSTQALLSGSVTDALGLDPLVNGVLSDGGPQNVGIDGHSALQTSTNADGVPLAPLGMLPDLRVLGGGLFNEVNVQPDTGSLDFHIPDPTLAFTTTGKISGASLGGQMSALSAKGTTGYIGYSVGHSSTTTAGPLNHQVFSDESGLTYAHDDSTLTSSTLLKIRAPTNADNALNFSALDSRFLAADSCDYLVGLLPCGIGPGSEHSQDVRNWQIRDDLHSDSLNASALVFASATNGTDNQLARTIESIPQPLQSSFFGSVGGMALNATPITRSRAIWSYSFLTYQSQSGGQLSAAETLDSAPLRSSYTRVGAAQTFTFSRRLRRTLSFALDADDGAESLESKAAMTWQLAPSDALNATLSTGVLAPPAWDGQGLSSPDSFSFDCSNRTAYGNGPGGTTGPSNTTQADVEYDHNTTRFWLNASAYTEIVHDAAIPVFLSAQKLPNVTPAYLQELSALFASPFGCGQPYTLTPSDVVFQETLAGTARYSGLRARARIRVSNAVIVAPYLTLASAQSSQSIAFSTVQTARQIIGVPPYKFGTTLDWQTPSKSFEGAIGVQHVAANNPNFLPAYTTLGVAAKIRVASGAIVLSATNVFNQYANRLGGAYLAAPIGGITEHEFRPLGVPLPHGSVHLSFTFWRAQADVTPASSTDEDTDSQSETTITIVPLTLPGSKDPYALNVANPHCGPEQVSVVRSILSALRRAADSKSPARFVKLPGGESAYLRRAPDGKATFLIAGTRASVVTALFSCVQLHFGTSTQAANAHLYVPTDADPNFQLLFSPAYGFYATTDATHATTHPANARIFTRMQPYAFKVDETAPGCTDDVRPAAQFILDELKAYFMSPGVALDGVSITKAADVYSVHFEDTLLWLATRACAPIYELSAQQAKALHATPAAGEDTLMYSPGVGLYEVAP